MSSRRTTILIAAIVAGALAAFGLVTYVGGLEDEAVAGGDQVPVIRVAQDVPPGMTGREAREQGYLEQAAIEASFRPATAVVDAAVIDALVSSAGLAAGQVLVDGMFVDPAAVQATAARRVPAGEVALSVSVDEVRGVAGLIAPGDKITVFVLEQAGTAPTPEGGEEAGGGEVSGALANGARSFYQGVEVLYVDQLAQSRPGEAQAVDEAGNPVEPVVENSGLITFAVPREAAQLIASVAPEDLYLALESEGLAPEALPGVDPDQSLPGEPGGDLTPYGPSGRTESEDQ